MSPLIFEIRSPSTAKYYHYSLSRKFKSYIIMLAVHLLALHLVPIELLWWELNLTRAAGRVTPDRVMPSSGGDVNLRDLRSSRPEKQGVELY